MIECDWESDDEVNNDEDVVIGHLGDAGLDLLDYDG